MSFLSKLFNKDEKKKENEKVEDPNIIKKPCGTFLFADDDPVEIGYESEVDWYEKTDDLYYQPVGVFIEVDTPGTKDASIGFERFERRFEDRERIDYKVKLAVAEQFLGDEESIVTDYGDTMSKEEFIKELEIIFMSFYRSGKRAFHVKFPWEREGKDDVFVVYDENDEVTVMEERDYYKNFKDMFYPEQV